MVLVNQVCINIEKIFFQKIKILIMQLILAEELLLNCWQIGQSVHKLHTSKQVMSVISHRLSSTLRYAHTKAEWDLAYF